MVRGERIQVFPHIETSRLTDFLLKDAKLTDDEEGHLLHCAECMHSMVEASGAELDRQSSTDSEKKETE